MRLAQRVADALQRPDLAWVLATNLIPVVGVVFAGWAALPLLVFYWIENVVIGAFNALKVLVSGFGKGSTLRMTGILFSLFFVLHYGLFCFVHGIFIFAIFSMSDLVHRGIEPGSAPDDVIGNVSVLLAADADLYWSAIVLVAVQAGWFIFYWLMSGQRHQANPVAQMFEPYGRIIVMHMTIMLATLPVIALGQPMLAVLALALLKSGMELGLPAFRIPAPAVSGLSFMKKGQPPES